MHIANRQKSGSAQNAQDRDDKLETSYVLVSLATFVVLGASGHLMWALVWFMATLFMFGIWRIARGQFR